MEKKRILIVSAHPDDEVIGCGGTILKHKEAGDEIFWLIVTNIKEEYGWEKEFVEKRQTEIKLVSELFGFKEYIKLDFATTLLDTIPMGDIVKAIAIVMKKVQPIEIYVVNRSDVHTDHKIVFQAVYSCTKNFRFPFIKKVLMYECISETEYAPALPENIFIPNTFIDITNFFKKKLEITKLYKSELMADVEPRSINGIEALARYRGSRIGVKYAEAFQLIFEHR